MTSPAPQKGLAPEVLAVLAYVGGAITGIVLLVYEKKDRFVRFHAMQSTVTFLLVLAAQLALSGLPWLGGLLYVPFVIGVVALWIFLMYQAFHKRSYKLPYIGDFAEHQLR
ncbi:MAG TPA: hypothetical protein VN700_02390 [Vicinamibacterales bacterium]|nr:hypothetical protein [Vicinamibacterales bacterium]